MTVNIGACYLGIQGPGKGCQSDTAWDITLGLDSHIYCEALGAISDTSKLFLIVRCVTY